MGRHVRAELGLAGRVDVFEVADLLGLQMDLWPLPVEEVQEVAVRGSVAVGYDLADPERRWAGAHGIGHCLMHGSINFFWLKEYTFLFPRYEPEADRFARGLLIDMDEAREQGFETHAEIAHYFGVPVGLLV